MSIFKRIDLFIRRYLVFINLFIVGVEILLLIVWGAMQLEAYTLAWLAFLIFNQMYLLQNGVILDGRIKVLQSIIEGEPQPSGPMGFSVQSPSPKTLNYVQH